MTTAEAVMGRLEKAIETIESTESINIAGILQIISQEVLRVGGKAPKFEGRPPQIYLDIDAYESLQRRLIKKWETHHNRTGALDYLKSMKNKYQQ